MDLRVEQVPECVVLTARATCSLSDIGKTIGELFGKVGPVGRDHMAGPPFCIYHAWRESDCDIEAGMPLSQEIPGQGEVTCRRVPACTAVIADHFGPYEKLMETHQACMRWIQANGKQIAGSPWEDYLTDPQLEPDTSKWHTRVCWPISG